MDKRKIIDKAVLARLKNARDLIAVKAIHHSTCMSTFYLDHSTEPRGHLASENTKDFIQHNNYINNNSECQFSLNENCKR